jgi:hypothetical protein
MNFIPIIFIAFLPTFVWADDLYTNDIIGGCGDAYYYAAVLEPISYTCSSGTYLPAGALSCQLCPSTHTCNGGTYTFDANHTQGLEYGDILVTDAIGSCSPAFTQNYSAIFEPITYVCPSGYYLPAGEDWINDNEGCRICPKNHYCVGGTYTFNETTDQGINVCPPRTYAPRGSAVYYPHILHVGSDEIYLRSTKLTTPSLNIKIDDEIFYANMTTTPAYMNKDSEQYFKTIYNDTVYYVCDDTTYNE